MLAASLTSHATTNITMTIIQGGGKNWDDINFWNDPPTNRGAADIVYNLGSNNVTFEIRPGARMRTPAAAANTTPIYGAPTSGNYLYATFPGQLLTVDGNGVFVNPNSAGQAPYFAQTSEIRTKMIQSGTTVGTVFFPHLVLNGGQIDTGSDGEGIIDGVIDVQAKSTFYKDANQTVYDGSNFKIMAQLIGSGDLVINFWRYRGNSGSGGGINIVPFILANSNNTFSGQWFINGGVVLGQAPNSLGTNNIYIGNAPSTVPFDLSPVSQSVAGGLQTLYDINNPHGNLVISGNGQMYLSQNDTFQSVIVAGHALSAGVHTAAELSSAYPNNFPATWGGTNLLGQFTGWTELLNSSDPSQVTGAESLTNATGSITVLVQAQNTTPLAIVTPPANARVLTNQTATFTVVFTGPATTIQWYSNNVAIADATNSSYTTPPVTASYNNTAYRVVLANNVNTVNASATLTIGNLVLSSGFLLEEMWSGAQYTRAGITDALNYGTNNPPDSTTYLNAFDTGIGLAQLNYVDRVSGYFIPPVTTNYVFFLAADDDTDLYLSTTTDRADEMLIAQETVWSPPDSYLTAGGASDLTLKRSDTFSPDGGATVPFAAGIPLTAGNRYYFEAIHHQGTGGDNVAVTYKMGTTAPDPLDGSASLLIGNQISAYAIDGSTLTITSPPKSGTLLEGNKTNLTVGVSYVSFSSTNVAYQWQRSGTNLPGATRSSYQTPILTSAADNPAQYRVIATIPGIPAVTSAVATITVVQDTQPPFLVEVPGTLSDTNGNSEIGLVFNKPITAATATNPANYSLSGGSITDIRLLTNGAGLDSTRQAVVVATTNLTQGTAYTLTVGGIKDNFNNTMPPTSFTVTPSRFTRVTIGRTDFYENPFGSPTIYPVLPADAVAVGTHGFNLNNAGQSFTGVDDDFTFVYEVKSNDFDVIVQVPYQDPSSQTACAGLMAREAIEDPGATRLNANGAYRFQSIEALPTTYYTGAHADSGDRIKEATRLVVNANLSDRNNGLNTVIPLPGPYPNVWFRLKRTVTDVSDSFAMYMGTNGVNWNIAGGQDNSGQGLPAQMYVGVFYAAKIDQMNGTPGSFPLAQDFGARFRNYGDFGFVPTAVRIQNVRSSGGNIRFDIPSQQGVTYIVEYRNSLTSGSWQTLTTLPGSGGTLTVADPAGITMRFYRVRAQ